MVREKSAFVKELRTLCNALLADLLESLLLVDSSSTVAVENVCVIKNAFTPKIRQIFYITVIFKV